MQRRNVGPWYRHDYISFIKLLGGPIEEFIELKGGGVGIGPRSTSDSVEVEMFLREHQLIGESRSDVDIPPEAPMDVLSGHTRDVDWDVIRQHPINRSLARDPNYRRARIKFEKLRRWERPDAPGALRDQREFLLLVVNVAGLYFQETAAEEKKTKAQKQRGRAQRRQASAACLKLRGLIKRGIGLSQPRATLRLSLYLKQLDDEISIRKPYEGPNGLARKYCELFAEHFYFSFGRGSTPVLSAWAAMIDYVPDVATLERYVKRAKTIWMRRNSGVGRSDPHES
jgi:hypothetical protein